MASAQRRRPVFATFVRLLSSLWRSWEGVVQVHVSTHVVSLSPAAVGFVATAFVAIAKMYLATDASNGFDLGRHRFRSRRPRRPTELEDRVSVEEQFR